MNVDNLKDLERLVKMCRRTGVDKITVDGITIEMGAEPVVSSKATAADTADDAAKPKELGTLTEEQLLYYSAVPHN